MGKVRKEEIWQDDAEDKVSVSIYRLFIKNVIKLWFFNH